MSFRLRNKKYLLTWPQSEELDCRTIMEHLKFLGEIEYAVVSREQHEEEGWHHHAAVFYAEPLNSRQNLFNLNNKIANVQVVGNGRRDKDNVIAYVKKDGTWIEEGTRPCNAKKMEKKEKIRFIETHTVRECLLSGEFSLSEMRNVEFVKNRLSAHRENRERLVYWYYGDTGTGKTRFAWDTALLTYDLDDIWIATGNNRDFKNGYSGQRCVIFDDFRNGDVKFNELLVLTDRYPCNVNVKGSYMPWKADVIFFTSPERPEDTFKKRNPYTNEIETREDIQQLLRRINEIKEFP